LESYYNGKLKAPLSSLASTFKIYPHQHDEFAQKIIDLVAKYGKADIHEVEEND